MTNITIDGKPYAVKDGITIIEALDELKISIPRYCYHPGLSIAGNCRICQVEIEKLPRTAIACNTRVTEGMVIHTQSKKAKESQAAVLEFLLANHPLDCPVCDQAGECKLQDYYMQVGLYDPKFDDVKVKKSKKAFSIGPTVMLDQERCILCSRCVRFADEITKTHDFGIFNRGDHAEINVYPGKELDNKYSGNVVDICPVGALTDKDFRFKMRVWYLGTQKSVCPGCSRGCNIEIHFEKSRPTKSDKGRVMRLKPRENPEVNHWWMCDEGRYGYKNIDKNRLEKVQIRVGGALKDSSWKEVTEKLAGLLKNGVGSKAWGFLVGPDRTNEEIFLKKKIFKDYLKCENIGFFAPGQEGFEDDFLIQKDKVPNLTGTAQIFQLPKELEDITGVVEKAKQGLLEGLFIIGHDLARICGKETLDTLRRNVKTIVYTGTNKNLTAEAADFILPAASYAEKDGTFTNFQGRVQRIRKAFEPLGDSRPSWQILIDLGKTLGMSMNYQTPEDIFNDLAKQNEAFRGLSYKEIGTLGRLLNT